ncbi:MAG: type II toxin-antitoxin system MqsA family antitoxin [bacterium]|nr:type II toxin-antitoxin system MqsA family antitoxin [bacterium]
MKCLMCKNETTIDGTTTVTFERDGMTLVVKNVPARVCRNCGEAYVNEETTKRLLETAEQAAFEGVQVEVRNFQAA